MKTNGNAAIDIIPFIKPLIHGYQGSNQSPIQPPRYAAGIPISEQISMFPIEY